LAAEGTSERRRGEDAVLQLASTADVPVLAVPADHARLPRRAVVAMDFSASSRYAALAALRLLAPGGLLTIAHVEPDADLRALGQEGWAEIYERGVAGLFDELAEALSAVRGDVAIETVLLGGEPATALLEYAALHESELIASGAQSASTRGGRFTGSVSAALLRGARAAVLLAPAAGSSD
jgi:nucleotide-binding universal stress UspA family protein